MGGPAGYGSGSAGWQGPGYAAAPSFRIPQPYVGDPENAPAMRLMRQSLADLAQWRAARAVESMLAAPADQMYDISSPTFWSDWVRGGDGCNR